MRPYLSSMLTTPIPVLTRGDDAAPVRGGSTPPDPPGQTPPRGLRRHEQRRLGPEVVLQVGVEVEVVLRQVGEDGHVEAGPRHPAQAERVARHLHRGGRHAALHHDREQRLQVGRFRGGQRAGQPLRPDPEFDPADQAGQVPGRAQPGLEQVGARGLAAGPGDADEPQPARRIPVHPAGDLAQPGARVREHEHRHAAGGGPGPAVRVGQHRDGAGRHRVRAERRPVHARTGERDVQVTGFHRPGVEGEPGQETQVVRGMRMSYGGNGSSRTPSSVLSADSGRCCGYAGRIATG